MTENISGSPIFADRYRFQPVSTDWDVGRSGFTHLVFDMKKERLGVIKRAELKSPRAVEELKNEVAALLDLKGQGVPEVYDTGEAEHGSKTYFYMVIEYIEGIRIEKNLDSLSPTERAEILTQFFDLLATSHNMGIVNGDVDLKHLFWDKGRKQLTVIDWGNAKLNVDKKNKTNFSYDLARSAEIIYLLATRKGRSPTTGSFSLPSNSSLIHGLAPIPEEFRKLCKWAPRTPSNGAQSPLTAQELLETSKKWRNAIQAAKPYKRPRSLTWIMFLIFGIIIAATVYLGKSPSSPLYPLLYPSTPIPTETIINNASPSPTETNTLLPTSTSTEEATPSPTLEPSPTFTPEPIITPTPRDYANIKTLLVLDETLAPIQLGSECWTNENEKLLSTTQGFSRRGDKFWRFGTDGDQSAETYIQTDFYPCLVEQQIGALTLNVWVARLELERDLPDNPEIIDPGKEFGIFLEDISGIRHEYTLWVDKNQSIHLRVRSDGEIISDNVVLVINENILKINGTYPRLYAIFPIQFFLEMDNQGMDIIYLKEGPVQESVQQETLVPGQMIIIHNAVLPALDTVQKFGLIGYGGETQTIIWPLIVYGK